MSAGEKPGGSSWSLGGVAKKGGVFNSSSFLPVLKHRYIAVVADIRKNSRSAINSADLRYGVRK